MRHNKQKNHDSKEEPKTSVTNEWGDPLTNEKEQLIRELADSDTALNICLTNDFAFKKAFRNKKALTGLLSALLCLRPEQIIDLEFPDTFLHGDYLEDREGILDIRVHLNNQRKINLEMQLLPYPYWEERSLFYLCKMFADGFVKGDTYSLLKECIHISILGFQLKQADSFYEKVRLIKDNGKVYSDKLGLRMLYLNQLEHVPENEKQTDIYHWAKLISAKDWEVLTNMAKTNEYMEAAVDELDQINRDKTLRYEYLRREMRDSDEATIREYYTELGEKRGMKKGKDLFSDFLQLTTHLLQDSRTDDLLRATNDEAFRNSLYTEYGIKTEGDI